MKQTINEKSYALALDKILEKISKRKVTLDEKHILIVPDVYTFTLEKRLFLQGKGSFDLEVTTFNRIYSRIIDEGNVLSKQGAIMLVKNLCRKNADKLTCYTRSALKTGFAVKLYDAISTLRACAVTPDEVDAVPMPKS